METQSREFDVIVVGTGPGGATTARELSRKNRKVLLLEWGGKSPIRGNLVSYALQAGIPGKGLLFTSELLGMVRGIATGGGSVFYYGTAFDPPAEMFKRYGVDISREIEEIRDELPIAPLADHLVGPMSERIMESAQALGYSWRKLPKFVYQERCRPDCPRCNYGCPYGAKWSARMYVDEAVSNGAEIRNHSKVTKVLVSGGKAVGVEYVRHGVRRRVHGEKVVLSAGGVGTPAILRASGFPGVGYDYFFDPLIAVMGVVDDIRGGKEFPMSAGVHMEDEGYLMTDMTIPAMLHVTLNAWALRFDSLHTHANTLQIMIKAKDSLGGRITDSGGVRKKLAETDKKKLAKGYERAREILARAGARSIHKSRPIAAHPGGTVKIGEFLDADLKTGLDNLYVCDCSVIPEAWGLPPTFSLIALGKRLARRLTEVHR